MFTELFRISNRTYDILKFIAQIVVPSLGVLYVSLARIWGLPYGEEIGQTALALDTFLGCVLLISSSVYDGDSYDE